MAPSADEVPVLPVPIEHDVDPSVGISSDAFLDAVVVLIYPVGVAGFVALRVLFGVWGRRGGGFWVRR